MKEIEKRRKREAGLFREKQKGRECRNIDSDINKIIYPELIKSNVNNYRFLNLTPSSRRSEESGMCSEIEGEIDLSQGEREFTDE